jgi:hypothetical protein
MHQHRHSVNYQEQSTQNVARIAVSHQKTLVGNSVNTHTFHRSSPRASFGGGGLEPRALSFSQWLSFRELIVDSLPLGLFPHTRMTTCSPAFVSPQASTASSVAPMATIREELMDVDIDLSSTSVASIDTVVIVNEHTADHKDQQYCCYCFPLSSKIFDSPQEAVIKYGILTTLFGVSLMSLFSYVWPLMALLEVMVLWTLMIVFTVKWTIVKTFHNERVNDFDIEMA